MFYVYISILFIKNKHKSYQFSVLSIFVNIYSLITKKNAATVFFRFYLRTDDLLFNHLIFESPQTPQMLCYGLFSLCWALWSQGMVVLYTTQLAQHNRNKPAATQ